MIIKLVGTGTHNQGAELMAAAVSEWVYRHGHDRTIIVEHFFGSQQDRLRYGFLCKYDRPQRMGRGWLVDKLLHPTLCRAHGIYTDEDVDVILDASGFAYSDQWGEMPAIELERRIKQLIRPRQKMILLPQAFGPFKDPKLRRIMTRVLPEIDFVYARDNKSVAYLKELVGEAPNLRLAPDFTNLVSPLVQETPLDQSKTVYFLPNARMLDMTCPTVAEIYPKLMARLADLADAANLKPILIAHSADDREVGSSIARLATCSVETISETDPRKTKHILSNARLVVGSRFHALQSALSCGIPALILGWSHKYDALARDYDCADYTINPDRPPDEIALKFSELLEGRNLSHLALRITKCGNSLRNRSLAMWNEIESVLNSTSRGGHR